MVILDNSRTLGAFERQSRILLYLYLHQIYYSLWKQLLQKRFNVIKTTLLSWRLTRVHYSLPTGVTGKYHYT